MNLYGVTKEKIEKFMDSDERQHSVEIIINKTRVRYVPCDNYEMVSQLDSQHDIQTNPDLIGCIFNFPIGNEDMVKLSKLEMGSLFSVKKYNDKLFISFKNIIFHKGVDLTLSGVEGALDSQSIEVSFANCVFMGEIKLNFIDDIFTTLKFENSSLLVDKFKNDGFNEVIFMRCNVRSEVQLNYPANIFSECILDKVVLFESRFMVLIDFTEKNLTKLEIKKLLVKSCIFLNNFNLNHIVFKEGFLIEKTRFLGDLNITFCKFSEEVAVLQCNFVNRNTFNFTNCKFSANAEIKLNKVPHKFYLYDSLIAGKFIIHVNAIKPFIKTMGVVQGASGEEKSLWAMEKTVENYFNLYQIFVSNGEIQTAHNCYYMYKHYGRKVLNSRIKNFWKSRHTDKKRLFVYIRMIIVSLLSFILEKSTKYFTSVVNSVVTLVLSFTAFTTCYLIFPKYIIVNSVPLSRSGEGMYQVFSNVISFSLITLGTTGYGNIYPTGWMATIAALESLFGVVMFAVLVTIISRKFMG